MIPQRVGTDVEPFARRRRLERRGADERRLRPAMGHMVRRAEHRVGRVARSGIVAPAAIGWVSFCLGRRRDRDSERRDRVVVDCLLNVVQNQNWRFANTSESSEASRVGWGPRETTPFRGGGGPFSPLKGTKRRKPPLRKRRIHGWER